MKLLYQEIRARLESRINGVHVRLYNNQSELLEQGEQIPFTFPACFVDFQQIVWGQIGKGTQSVDNLIVRIYIFFEAYNTNENEEDLTIFDLREQVYLALQDFKPTQSGKLFRVAEQFDTNHTNVHVWIMDFTTKYQDITAQYPRGGITAQINTVVLDKDLQIDPNTVDGIRTDKDFD